MKAKISTEERLQLIGLLTLAADLNKQTTAIEHAAARLLGVPAEDHGAPYYGHVTNAVYGNRTPDELLRILGIEVVEG